MLLFDMLSSHFRLICIQLQLHFNDNWELSTSFFRIYWKFAAPTLESVCKCPKMATQDNFILFSIIPRYSINFANDFKRSCFKESTQTEAMRVRVGAVHFCGFEALVSRVSLDSQRKSAHCPSRKRDKPRKMMNHLIWHQKGDWSFGVEQSDTGEEVKHKNSEPTLSMLLSPCKKNIDLARLTNTFGNFPMRKRTKLMMKSQNNPVF